MKNTINESAALLLKNIAALFKVKTIVTLSLTYGFLKLALSMFVTSQEYITIFAVVIAFYFGTQYSKSVGGENG